MMLLIISINSTNITNLKTKAFVWMFKILLMLSLILFRLITSCFLIETQFQKKKNTIIKILKSYNCLLLNDCYLGNELNFYVH